MTVILSEKRDDNVDWTAICSDILNINNRHHHILQVSVHYRNVQHTTSSIEHRLLPLKYTINLNYIIMCIVKGTFDYVWVYKNPVIL